MKIRACIVLAALAVLVARAGPAGASSITYTWTAPGGTCFWTYSPVIPQWDPLTHPGQVLQSVAGTIVGTADGTIQLENISSTATSTVTSKIGAAVTVLISTVPLSTATGLSSSWTDNFTVWDGTTDYGPPGNGYPGPPSDSGESHSASGIPLSQTWSAANLLPWKGSGNVPIDVEAIAASQENASGGILQSIKSAGAAANGEVTYTWGPQGQTPEPATMALLGVGLAAFGARRKRRQKA